MTIRALVELPLGSTRPIDHIELTVSFALITSDNMELLFRDVFYFLNLFYKSHIITNQLIQAHNYNFSYLIK